MYFNGKTVLVEVSGSDQQLIISILATDIDDQLTSFVKGYINEWFDLDRDLTPFYDLAKKDKILKHVVSQYHGLRLIGIVDMFEALCWSIIGQQINLTFAYKLKRVLTERYGKIVEHEEQNYYLFPKPSHLASISASELLKLQFSKQKAHYIINLAQAFENSELSKPSLVKLPLHEVVEELVKIKGIGPWTANYTAMKCLKKPNAFPLQDVGLHNALKALLNREKKPSLAEVSELSENWEGWKAYATIYLWRSLSIKG